MLTLQCDTCSRQLEVDGLHATDPKSARQHLAISVDGWRYQGPAHFCSEACQQAMAGFRQLPAIRDAFFALALQPAPRGTGHPEFYRLRFTQTLWGWRVDVLLHSQVLASATRGRRTHAAVIVGRRLRKQLAKALPP